MILNKQTFPLTVHAFVITGFCLIFLAGAFLMTVEPDEVWNLMSTMKAFGLPVPNTSAVDLPVTTTGGLHALLHGLVAHLHSGNILLHRLVSLVAAVGLLALVYRILKQHSGNAALAAAGTAVFVTAPGFLLQVSLATSEIIATTVFLVAALFWVGPGQRSARGALAAGVLFGLACATRMTCLSMLPALLLWSLLVGRGWQRRLVHPLLAVTVAGCVFAACVAGYVVAFADATWRDALAAASGASGVARSYEGVLMRLNYATVAEGIVPVLALFALAGWVCSRVVERREFDPTTALSSFLLMAGFAGWLAWLVKAPISHIRYLWPAVPMFWMAGLLMAVSALSRAGGPGPQVQWITHTVVVALCAVQALLNIRMLAVGDSLQLVYETARGTQLARPGAFGVARANQEAIARDIAALPASARVMAFSAATAYPLTYLRGRTVSAWQPSQRATSDDYLLSQPADAIWSSDGNRVALREAQMDLVQARGPYLLYRGRGAGVPAAAKAD